MNSTAFGPPSWKMMFFAAAGYDLNKAPKHEKDPYYKIFFESIGHVLPCIYCRESYQKFFKSLDIDRYLKLPNCGLVRFVYDIHELVNSKLLEQERKAMHDAYNELARTVSPEDPAFWDAMRDKGHKICYTKPAPPFETVVADLMKYRAGCSAETKSCRAPFVESMYPKLPPIETFGLERPGPTDAELYKSGGHHHAPRRKRTLKKKSIKKKKSKRQSSSWR
jgi:hypothetical protein